MTYITGGAVQLSGTTSLIDLPGISAPSLSASGHGRIYFDTGTNTFRVSQNGSAYSLLQGITQLTGDATASGSGVQALTLATVNSNVGTFNFATITVDAKGRITAASSGSPVDTGITQLTGDATAGPGSGSQALTLSTVNSNVGSFTAANITVNAKGLITAASNGAAGVSGSGTTGKVARWSNATTLAAGAMTDNGSTILMPVAPIVQVSSGGSTATATFLFLQDTTSGGSSTLLGQTTIAAQNFSAAAVNIFSVPQGAAGDVRIVGLNSTNNTYFVDKLVWVNSTGTAAISGVYATVAQGAVARSYTVLSGQLRLQMSGNSLNYKLNVFSEYPF